MSEQRVRRELGECESSITFTRFENALFGFHTQMASGEMPDGTPFTIDLNIHDNSIVVSFNGMKEQFHLSVKAIMDATIAARESAARRQLEGGN